MSPLVESILFVFGLVALGYLVAMSGYLAARVGDALTDFVVGVALPVLLFKTMLEADFSGTNPWLIWAAYYPAAAIAWIAAHLMTAKLFGRDAREAVVGGVSGVFSNLLLLGLPLMLSAFGTAGTEVLALIIAVHLPIMMAASIILMEWARRDEAGPLKPGRIAGQFLRNLIGNPFVVGILLGLAWRETGLEMPALGDRFVNTFAALAGPVALFGMGLSLRHLGVRGDLRPALALSAVKIVLMPAVALVLVKLFGLPPFPARIVVVAAAMPAGVNPYLIATRFGVGKALASNTMTVSTVLAVATSAFWLFVAEAVLD